MLSEELRVGRTEVDERDLHRRAIESFSQRLRDDLGSQRFGEAVNTRGDRGKRNRFERVRLRKLQTTAIAARQ